MNRVTASNNTIRIPDPAFLHLVGWIGSGAAVGWLLWDRRDSIQQAADFFRNLIQLQTPLNITVASLQTQLLPQALCLMLALMAGSFALIGFVGGGWTLLDWLRRFGGDHYASAPGPLAESSTAVDRLFGEGGIEQKSQEKPPPLVRLIFGNTSWWLSPSATGLLSHFDLALRRLGLLAAILVMPAFLQPGWLSRLMGGLEPSEVMARVTELEKSGMNWRQQVPVVLVVVAIITAPSLVFMLVRGRPVGLALRRLALLIAILITLTFLQPTWLPRLLSSLASVDRLEAVMRAIGSVESGLRWDLPVPFLLVAASIIAALYMAVLLVRGQPVQVAYEEMDREFPDMPHPDETYRKIERELRELRYREFPNRKPGNDRPPGLSTIQQGQTGSFKFVQTIETQPVPAGSGRSRPSLFLLLMGCLLTVAGYWLLLRSPGPLDQPFEAAVWLPALATGLTAIRGGRRMRQSAWELAHTIRFRSELIRISGNGSWQVGQVAVDAGYLGGVRANQTAVNSRVYLQVQATQLTTEVCARTNDWRPIGEAMRAPRTIMSAERSTVFLEKLNLLLEQVRDFHRRSCLPSIDATTGGAAQAMAINQQMNLSAGHLAGLLLPPTSKQSGHVENSIG